MKGNRLRYLILALTKRCNLRCRYCYQAATGTGADMDEGLLDAALNYGDTGSPLLIQITGGEPTLVPEKIEQIILKSKKMRSVPHIALQTNGTLITEETAQLFSSGRIQVGISLDGPPAIQESLRGKVNETLKGFEILEKKAIPFGVTTVVSSANVQQLDKLVLLLAGYSSCRGIGLDLLVKKGRCHSASLDLPELDALRDGVIRMFESLNYVNRKRMSPLHLRELDLLDKAGNGTSFCHAASGSSLAVHPDGSLYPCGQTMGDPSFFLGTLDSPQLSLLPQMQARLQTDQCIDCSLSGRCPGECPSRLYYNNEAGRKRACELYTCLEKLRVKQQ